MKGDFSKYPTQGLSPFDAVLQQQGRVILDSDWNDQAAILTARSDLAACDTIGEHVAAVPVSAATSFKVIAARVAANQLVELELLPGHAWVDGLLVQLPGDPAQPDQPVVREAAWLKPPIQDPPGDAASVGDGVRDAVVLEVRREALNGFQAPEHLIEPALGGVDTTERLVTVCDYRLYRLVDGQTCGDLTAALRQDPSLQGTLTVSLQPTVAISGDCPVERRGGYTGLEHQLYRIEIAPIDGAVPHFAWSRQNGGLVGRGRFDGAALTVALHDNQQAIAHSGRSSFYLEVLTRDSDDGRWRVTYGADATLVSDTELSLALVPRLGSAPTGDDLVFRLWDGIAKIDAFPAGADPKELEEGIFLQFHTANAAYSHGDYWTFSLRAGMPNAEILLAEQPPAGPAVHRVPLAELMWNAAHEISFEDREIEDCRRLFRPLTLQNGCCTFVVGDGKTSHGDFDALEEALRHLPPQGGRLCLLPGMHEANLLIENLENIEIHGCAGHSTVYPRAAARTEPVIQIVDSENIVLRDLDLVCLRGTPVLAQGKGPDTCNKLTIENCRLLGLDSGLTVEDVTAVRILGNQVLVCDGKGAGPCLALTGDDLLVRDNRLTLAPPVLEPDDDDEDAPPLDPADLCADPEPLYLNLKWFRAYLQTIWVSPYLFLFKIPYLDNPYQGQGGIEIGGGSRDVRIENNHIEGGQGNGVSIGTRADIERLAKVYLDPDFSKWVIKSQGSAFSGYVRSTKKEGQVGVALNFAADSGQVYSETSVDALAPVREAGFIGITLPQGEYRLASATPGYRIVDLLPNANEQLEDFFDIIVEKDDQAGGTPGFIYDLVINENRIEKMGGSGIGSARYELEKDGSIAGAGENEDNTQVLTADVVFQNLVITDNQLRDNLRDATGLSIFNPSGETGAGGIAVGTGEGLVVRGNLIEDNGVVHRQAACGIFAAAVERAEISANTIRNNGPFSANDSGAFQAGPRGGIYLTAYTNAPSAVDTVANGRFAARIHDNLVDHPVGPALVVRAIGALSIQGNRFNSERIALEGWGDKAVIVFNDGGGIDLDTNIRGLALAGPENLRALGIPESSQPGAAVGGASPSAGLAATNRFAVLKRPFHYLPEGPVLFLGNQIRTGIDFAGADGVVIAIEDDLTFQSNQFEAHSSMVQRACTLSARNLTASGNRIRQTRADQPFAFSLLTNARDFNNTTLNQASHCIYGHSTVVMDHVDQVIVQMNQVYRLTECQILSGMFKQWWPPLGARLFRGNNHRIFYDLDDPAGLWRQVTQLAAMRRLGFRHFKLFRGGLLASLQAESLRLSLRYGEAHPYRTKIQNQVEVESEHLRLLSAENQIGLIDIVSLEAKMTQIHGRITDTLGKGLINLAVHFVDDTDKALFGLGQGITNAYGYYSLVFDDTVFDLFSDQLSKGVHLVISSKAGKRLYHRFQATTVKKNKTTTVELALDPNDIIK